MARRLKAAERRASILAVAKLLFADKGYHGVSVDEIAKRLGVSPAVLYQHFASKEVLYENVLAQNAARRESYIEAILAEPSDFASVLTRMTRIYLESVAEDPDFLRMELMSALENSQTASRFFERRWRSITDYIEYSVNEFNAGRDGRTVNPRMAGLMYQGMLREIMYSKFITDDSRYRDLPLETMIEELIRVFFTGIGAPVSRSGEAGSTSSLSTKTNR